MTQCRHAMTPPPRVKHPTTKHCVLYLAAALVLVLLTGCGSSSSGAAKTPSSTDRSIEAPGGAPATNAKAVDGCALVSAAELSQAVGVTYTKIESSGGLCNVTAATPGSFFFHVDKEDGAVTTWNAQVATIKRDDGSVTAVSGIGNRAVQGAIKEFAAESKGYIVVVDNADVNNPATSKDFTRSKKVAQTLIDKL